MSARAVADRPYSLRPTLQLCFLLLDQRFNVRHDPGICPVLAEGVLHNMAVRVDQKSFWNTGNLVQASRDLLSGIEEDRNRKAVPGIELIHRLPVRIDGDGQHLEFPVL